MSTYPSRKKCTLCLKIRPIRFYEAYASGGFRNLCCLCRISEAARYKREGKAKKYVPEVIPNRKAEFIDELLRKDNNHDSSL